MKINTIHNNQSFGYNPQYHAKVQKTLENKKRENVFLAQYLSQADKFSLAIEDKLVELEKDKKDKTQSYLNLCDYLIDFKDLIALNIESYFPNLKYAKNLLEQYEKESKNVSENKSDWRKSLINHLKQYIIEDKKAISTNSNEQKTTQDTKEESQKVLKEFQEQAIDEYLAKKSSELITKFTPSQSSPEGFKSIAGMEEVKQRLQEEIIDYVSDPAKIQEDMEEYGITLARGFLLYGPAGCGKTFITEALALESGLDLYRLDISKAGSKYVNESANNIEKAFEYLKLMAIKNNAPVLLFMDEADSLAMNRESSSASSGENEKVTTTLLKLVQQARDNNIIIIAATNRFDNLDAAFKNRFDSQIYIGLPDEKQIKMLLKSELSKRLKGKNLSKNEEALDVIASKLKGWSNRSIVFIIEKAAKLAKKNNRDEIKPENLLRAIEECEFEKIEEKDYQKGKKNNLIGF